MEFLQRLLRRLLGWLGFSAASGTTLTVTGVLGLAVLLGLGFYQYGGQHKRRDEDESREGDGASTSTATAAGGAGPSSGPWQAAAAQQQHQQQHQQQRQQQAALATAAHGPAAAVARRLAGVRRVTISIPGVLLEESTLEELSEGGATLRAGAAELLRQFCSAAEVFLMAHVADDVGEAAVQGALEYAGLLGAGPGAVPPHRALFCSTLDGKVSIVRQLEPDLHIDAHPQTVHDLQRFVRQLVFVGGTAGGPKPAPNIQQAPTLASALGVGAG